MVLNRPLSAVFGKGYSGSAPVMALLMLSCFFMIVNNTVGAALAGAGRMWVSLAMNGAWGLSLLAGAWFLVPRMGALGLALSYLIAYLLHTLWQMLYLEVKLAPSAVASQWRTILFSLLVLAASAGLALTRGPHLLGGALVLLSLLPALSELMRRFPGAEGISAAGEVS